MFLFGDPSASCALERLPNFSKSAPVFPVISPSPSITTMFTASAYPPLVVTYELS